MLNYALNKIVIIILQVYNMTGDERVLAKSCDIIIMIIIIFLRHPASDYYC